MLLYTNDLTYFLNLVGNRMGKGNDQKWGKGKK